MRIPVCSAGRQGFSLIEMMLALIILTFGLLAAGSCYMLLPVPVRSPDPRGRQPLRLKAMLESLASLYGQNPSSRRSCSRSHGPRQTVVANPVDGTVLNRYDVNWTVENVSDPRPGKVLNARRVRATVTPVQIWRSSKRPAWLQQSPEYRYDLLVRKRADSFDEDALEEIRLNRGIQQPIRFYIDRVHDCRVYSPHPILRHFWHADGNPACRKLSGRSSVRS